MIFFFFRYLISRGYGHPQDKDSGGSDDDMSDEGPDDMLPSTSRDRLDASGRYLSCGRVIRDFESKGKTR